ncbi:type II inositol 3,4-bisphosphate 4-phosphatase-like isoform X2 [Sander vitreus]
MKMRRMKMRVNNSQLLFLSREETSGNFQKEGTLRVGRQERDLRERFCRLRGNLLFILKTQGGKLQEVLLLERCEVMKLPDDERRLSVVFISGDPTVFLESSSPAECASWLAVLRDANTDTLRRRIAHLRTVISTHTTRHTHTAAHSSRGEEDLEDCAGEGGVESAAKVSPLDMSFECRVVVGAAVSRVKIQVCVIDTHTVRKHSCCEIVEGPDDSVFLTSVRFRGDYPLYHHSRINITFHHQEEPTTHTTRSFLGFTSFSIRDLLRSKEPHISLSLRTIDGVSEAGEVKVSRLQMEGETPPEHKCPAVCDRLHSSVHDKENSPMMRAVLCAQVCKVYRFLTEDQRWLLVREQMSETPLSFSLPKQLLSTLIRSHTSRIQEVKELGDLSPHWDGLRHDVINHCNHLIGCYQETLAELDKLSASSCFKSSSSKSDKHLQFVPTNLHSQRMEVTGPNSPGVWYEVITFGAPAHHHQAFKHGGLKRLLSKHTNNRDSSVSYSQDESSRARELLASVAQLQPLVFGLAEELLAVSLELNAAQLQQVLDSLTQQTEQFVHALKDELVKSALLAIHSQHSASDNSSHVHSNGLLCDKTSSRQQGQASPGQQDTSRRDAEEYDEEEWDRAWANVAMSLNCIHAMADRLQGREHRHQEMTSSEEQEATRDTNCKNTGSSSSFSWQEQLLPLVVTLRDCVREAAGKAQAAMTFVVLQGAVAASVAQGPEHIVQRRHAVFSQALSAVVCGFMLKLFGGLEDPDFLLQLHSVGLLVQFEGLLSTYGDEVGMLEDMEVGVADLSTVAFTVSEAKSEQADDLLPTLSGAWGSLVVEVPLPPETFESLPQEVKDGRLIRVHPVLFNIGINQQQSLAERFGDSSLQERVNQQSCERLRVYCNTLTDTLPHTAGIQSLSDLLSSLDRTVQTKKRKNVEVLWIAATVCRRVKGVRLTSCKSAKDRTAMSVTLEQCLLLRERHTLSPQHFSTALDCMRRDGCRMENVQKNVGSRKFAFSGVQLLTFPKLYRPPDGSFGSTH